MTSPWRIGLFVGLAILGGRTAAEAQTQPGAGTADRPQSAAPRVAAPARRPSMPATAAARRQADPHFNRVVTTGRGPVAAESMGQNDPLRPYSAGAGRTNGQAAMGSTRAQPRAASPPRGVSSSHNYYPEMRASRHPNANVAQVRRPQRGMGTGVGMGMGMGALPSTPGMGGIPAGGAGRGR
jgi:hypothetical protein